MARSYIRSSRRRKGGLLVRETAVQRGVASNSLYCVPIRVVTGATTAGSSADQIRKGDSSNKLIYANNPSSPLTPYTVDRVVRVSSILVSSASPFVVKVANSSGAFTTYKVQGQKTTRITLSRETSIGGNAALFRAAANGAYIISITDNDDPVDMTVNCVIDAELD